VSHFLELVVGVVVWLVDRLIDSLSNRTGRKQTAVWPCQAAKSQPHPTRPGLTDSPAHNFTLYSYRTTSPPPHAHAHNPTFLPARPPARSKAGRTRRILILIDAIRQFGASHPLRRERMCDIVHEKMAFWFSSILAATDLIPQRLFRYYGPCYLLLLHSAYYLLCPSSPSAPDFRIPLPASCIQQRRTSACRPNERCRSVGPPAEQAGGRPICHRTLSISPLFLETPLDR
jgi:hypothetical protein